MSEKSWGTKRICLFCSTIFYDFGKSPIVCPKCGEHFEPGIIFKKKSRVKELEDDIDESIDESMNEEVDETESIDIDDQEEKEI